MEMEAGLVEQQDCIFVGLPALDQKDQIEGEEPLKTLASFLEGNGNGTVTVGNLKDEVVAINVEFQPVLVAGPQVDPVARQRE